MIDHPKCNCETCNETNKECLLKVERAIQGTKIAVLESHVLRRIAHNLGFMFELYTRRLERGERLNPNETANCDACFVALKGCQSELMRRIFNEDEAIRTEASKRN